MSTQTTRPQTALPALARGDEEDFLEMQPRLRQLRAIQQRYASAIIAAGVFNHSADWTPVILSLADDDAQQALARWFARLERASPNSTRIAVPTPNDPNNEDDNSHSRFHSATSASSVRGESRAEDRGDRWT